MKISKRLTALMLSFVMVFSTAIFAFADEEETTAPDSNNSTLAINTESTDNTATTTLPNNGMDNSQVVSVTGVAETTTAAPESTTEAPAADTGSSSKQGFSLSKMVYGGDWDTLTTSRFVQIVKGIRTIKNVLTGKFLVGDDGTFDVTMCDDLMDLCNYISENSAFDPYLFLTNLPDLTTATNVTIKIFKIDTLAFRTKMYEMRDIAYENGDNTKGKLYNIAGAYFSGIQNAYIYLIPTGNENEYEIKCQVTFADGGTDNFSANMYVNLETGEFYGKNEKGAGGIGFNCSIYELMVYAPMYCWMRDFGFCVEYDLLCYALPMYRYCTRRFKFDYQGREWMIQIWKGNYLITNGGEVGIYNRDAGSVGSYYDVVTDEERMPMSLKIIHDDDVLVNIDETTHWWVNGFRMGYKLYTPSNLTMVFTVKMPDEEMVKAFTESIDSNIHHDVTYTVDGTTVTVTWAAE